MVSATVSFSSVETFANSVRLDNSLTIAAITILYYDYALTISDEIDHFWNKAKPSSFSSALFVLQRYLGLSGHIPVAFEYFGYLSTQRCQLFQTYHEYFIIASQIIVCLLLIMRTYALYNGSRPVLLGLAILGFCLIVATVVAVSLKPSSSNPAEVAPRYGSFGCGLSWSYDQGLSSAIGWIMMLCMDTTIFVLTLVKAILRRHNLREGLMRVLFRDGAMYYGFLVLANGTNILTSLLRQIPIYNLGIGTTLTNAVSLTLISRICLNLRDPNSLSHGNRVGEWTLSHATSIAATGDGHAGIPSFHRSTHTQDSDDVIGSCLQMTEARVGF